MCNHENSDGGARLIAAIFSKTMDTQVAAETWLGLTFHAKQRILERIEEVLRTLTDREEKVLRMRFGIGVEDLQRTQDEVAAAFNVTCGRMRACEARALDKLREPQNRVRLLDIKC